MKISQLFKWIRSNKLWVFIVTVIGINDFITILQFSGLSMAHISNALLSYITQAPIEQYLLKKFFLVAAAACVFIYWVFRHASLRSMRLLVLPIVGLGTLMFIARAYSFDGWFWHEDFRMIKYHYTDFGGPDYHYPLAVFFLLIRWFGLNYALYNICGLLFFLVTGILVYLIANQLQKSKNVSILSAAFFVSSTAYFQEWFLMISFVGDSFVLILFLISFYMMLKKFLAGAIIFAAAAVEFGIVRTHFVPFYLILIGLLFYPHRADTSRNFILKLSLFILIFIAYIPIALASVSFSSGNVLFSLDQLNNISTIGNMMGEVAIPYFIFSLAMKHLGLLFGNWIYFPVLTGYLVFLLASFYTLFVYVKLKHNAWKILLLGVVIFASGLIAPALIGRRVDHRVEHFLENHQRAPYPSVTTAYSTISLLGVAIFFIGLGEMVPARRYIWFMLLIIATNIAVYVRSDLLWIEHYATPQRKQDEQLKFILPEKYTLFIYVTPQASPYMKHYQRFLWQGIRNFQLAYRSNQTINTYMDKKEFDAAISSNKPNDNQVYYLEQDLSYNIYSLKSDLNKR